MEKLSYRLIVFAGGVGGIVLALGLVITMLGYVGEQGQPYSPLNHFVSELGHTEESELAGVFNGSLVVGGTLFGLFIIGVGLSFTSIIRYVFILGGLFVAGSGALVGVYPMNVDLEMHGVVAINFFEGALVLITIFSLYIVIFRHTRYPRWLALVALPMLISNTAFLNQVFNGGTREADSLSAPGVAGRPAIWPITVYEWGVIIFLLVWVGVIVYFRFRQERQAHQQAAR